MPNDDAAFGNSDVRPRPRGSLGADFRRLWFATTVSHFGTRVTQVALPLTALQVATASTAELGILRAVSTLPFLLLGLHTGAWVDRTLRRPLMIAGDWGRAVLLATVPVAAVLASVQLWHLYLVAFAVGVFTVAFDVAYQSHLPTLVREDQLLDANGKLQASASVAEATGPGLGGALVQVLTAPLAILADAVTFVISAVLVRRIKAPEPPPKRKQRRVTLLREIVEGLQFVRGQVILRRIIICSALINALAAAIEVALLVFLVRDLGQGAAAVGIALSAGGIGAVVGAAIANPVGKALGAGRALWMSLAVTAPFGLLLPLAHPAAAFTFVVPAMIITTAGIVIYDIGQLSFRQALTPPNLQGRAHATVRFAVSGSLPVGAAVGGVLATAVGNRAALWALTVATMLTPLPLVLSPLRNMRTLALSD